MDLDHQVAVTLDEAVALLVNLDYIPEGFAVLDMTAAFLDEAEVEFANAQLTAEPASVRVLELRRDACAHRHLLAVALKDSLRAAIGSGMLSACSGPTDVAVLPRYRLADVLDWTTDRMGIGLPRPLVEATIAREQATHVAWDEVTVKVQRDWKIAWRAGSGEWQRSHFREIGLMGLRKTVPSALGMTLVGLSTRLKFPLGPITPAAKAQLPRLRDALVKLTGIAADPFYKYTAADGWLPRFKLVDDRRNADERAKQRAIHTELEPETQAFEDERDGTQEWLDANDPSNP
jgi:hypothetical protein